MRLKAGSTLRNLRFAVAAAALCLAAPLAAQTTVLRVSNWLPPSHPIVKDMIVPWARQVDAATEGRVKVQVLTTALGSPQSHFDLAKDGVSDITYGVHGYTPGRFALAEMVELPFLSEKAEPLSVAYWRVFEKHLAKAQEHAGTKVLSVFTQGPGQIFNTRRPIRTIGDFEGLKVRIPNVSTNELAKALKMVPLQAPSSKSYELLSSGVADGIMFSKDSVPFFKLEKVLKYATLAPTGFYNASFFLVMNESAWNRLSERDRNAIMGVSGEAFARLAGRAWDAADAGALDQMRAAGMNVDPIAPSLIESIRQRLAPLEVAWLDKVRGGPVDAKAALDALRAEIVNYGK